jgi:hypothetical protein
MIELFAENFLNLDSLLQVYPLLLQGRCPSRSCGDWPSRSPIRSIIGC